MAYRRDVTTTGSRDRFLLVVRHDVQRVIVQHAFANADARDVAARDARHRYGRKAVTCSFVSNFSGRSVTRVFL